MLYAVWWGTTHMNIQWLVPLTQIGPIAASLGLMCKWQEGDILFFSEVAGLARWDSGAGSGHLPWHLKRLSIKKVATWRQVIMRHGQREKYSAFQSLPLDSASSAALLILWTTTVFFPTWTGKFPFFVLLYLFPFSLLFNPVFFGLLSHLIKGSSEILHQGNSDIFRRY